MVLLERRILERFPDAGLSQVAVSCAGWWKNRLARYLHTAARSWR
jgi:hypothetical protein